MILRAEGVSAAAQKSLHRQYNTDFSTSEYFWGNFHGAVFLAADEISLGQVGCPLSTHPTCPWLISGIALGE